MPRGHGRAAPGQSSTRCGTLLSLSASLLMGACAHTGAPQLGLDQSSGRTLAYQQQSDSRSELEKAIAHWGNQFSQNPRDKTAAISYVLNLKAAGQKKTALSVLQQASIYHANDPDFSSEYGRLALEFGQVGLAQKLLANAYDPQNPDWRVISAQGTVLAKQGDYKGAIPYYERALQLAPDQPSLVNNLAMALAADGQPGPAEPLLRRAAADPDADPKVHQNLALVLNLQGKSAEAEQARFALSNPSEAYNRAKGPALRSSVRDVATQDAIADGWTTRVAAARRYR